MKPRFITIHCSDSPEKMDIGKKEINEWHIARGFKKIGYHFIIRQNGVLEEGRTLGEQGAHVKNYNKDNVGVCLIGRNSFTTEQLNTLKSLISNLMRTYKINIDNVKGHYEWPNVHKTCPNINMNDFRNDFLNLKDVT